MAQLPQSSQTPVGSLADLREAPLSAQWPISILEPAAPSEDTNASICGVPVPGEVPPASVEERRKKTLLEAIVLPELPEAEKGKLRRFLEKHHFTFCLEPGE